MSKAKQNTFLTGYFTILAAGAAGLGYLAFSSSSASSEAKENYETQKTRLLSLQKAPIFPKQENVDAKKKQVDAYVAKVAELSTTLRNFQAPLVEDMNNSQFQSKLQKTRDAIVAEAKDAGVTLPEDFDLGMGTYLSTFPETSAVPRLNAWLDGIHSCISILIASGVKEINLVSRPELAFEKKKEEVAKAEPGAKPKPAPKPPASAKGKKVEAAPVAVLEESAALERYPFTVVFTSSNRALNDVMTALANTTAGAKDANFFNIRALRIENEQKTGAETSAQIQVSEQTDPDTQKPFKRDSTYIFGVEKIQAHLGLDLIRFPGPQAAEAKK